jgi:hypothetical protein
MTPLLLTAGDKVFIGEAWRTVIAVRACKIPTHGPMCNLVATDGGGPATHHGQDSHLWASPLAGARR